MTKKPKKLDFVVPKQATRALVQFLYEHATLMRFAAERRQDEIKLAENFLEQTDFLKKKWAAGEYSNLKLPKRHDVDAVRPGMLAEMSFARQVDNYLIYLQDILALIYCVKPDVAGVKVDIGELPNLAQDADIFSVMRSLAIATISDTTRKTLFDAFKKLGFRTTVLQRSRAELTEALNIRDQIVHRRGVWGNFQGKEFPAKREFREQWQCGSRVKEFEKKFGFVENFIWNSVNAIDQEAASLFSLEVFPVPSPD